jgi:Complex I intermediate-associated protein 30 (CIA30)
MLSGVSGYVFGSVVRNNFNNRAQLSGAQKAAPGDPPLRRGWSLPRLCCTIIPLSLVPSMTPSAADSLLLDDFSRADGRSLLGTSWRLVSDQVMGGMSQGQVRIGESRSRRALCLIGDVSLANNGGFLQVSLSLNSSEPSGECPGGTLDASRYSGVRLVVRGNGEGYKVHLKTPDTVLPWQSYRADFRVEDAWREVWLPFAGFEPHRLDIPLATGCLSRLAVVAIGRAMRAEVCLSEVGLY